MKVSEFYPYVLPDVLGCPSPMLRQAIVSAAQEFCVETLAWNEIQEPISLLNGERSYDLDFPSQSYLHAVREIWCGANRMYPKTLAEISRLMPDWQTRTSNEPVYFNMSATRGTLQVFPTPANIESQAMVVHAAYAPKSSATSLPDFLGERHTEVIASGAKARLMAMPGKKWSSPELSAYHRSIFITGMDNARIDEEHGRVVGSLSVAPRRFG